VNALRLKTRQGNADGSGNDPGGKQIAPYEASKYAKPSCSDVASFRLKDFDPVETLGLKSKEHAHETLERGIARLCDLQGKALRTGPLGSLGGSAGYDAAGKRQHDQHVDVRIEPPGLQRDFIQGASARSGPRFSVAATRSPPSTAARSVFSSLLL